MDLALLNLVGDYAQIVERGKFDAREWSARISLQQSYLPVLGGIRGTDIAGNVIYGSATGDRAGANLSDRDYFIWHRDNPDSGLSISKPVLSRVTGEWVLLLSRRLAGRSGNFAGITVARLTLAHFHSESNLQEIVCAALFRHGDRFRSLSPS